MQNTKSPRFWFRHTCKLALFILAVGSKLHAFDLPAQAQLPQVQVALLQQFLKNAAYLQDSSGESQNSLFAPLANLSTQPLQNVQTHTAIPKAWRGAWMDGTEGFAFDVFENHIFFRNKLYKVLSSATQAKTLFCLVLGPKYETKLFVFFQRDEEANFDSALGYILTSESFNRNDTYYLDKIKLAPLPTPLLGAYEKKETAENDWDANVSSTAVEALNQQWTTLQSGVTFSERRRAYYVLAMNKKTGTVGYFRLRKISLEEDDWELILFPEPNLELLKAKYPLGERFARLNPRRIDYRWFLISGLVFGLGYWIYRRRLRQLQKQQFRTQLALNGLRAQLNPHFLFNSLASIQDLVNEDNKTAANRYFDEIARLLRYVVDSSKYAYMPLAQELEALDKYCSLEALRTPFQYSFELAPDIDQNNTEIPTMLLQPFVENAILHGLRPGTDPKELKISIWPESDNRIGISILDNGIGIEEAQRRGQKLQDTREHQGLANTYKRIELLNEKKREKITLQITDRGRLSPHGQGTLVQLSIPI